MLVVSKQPNYFLFLCTAEHYPLREIYLYFKTIVNTEKINGWKFSSFTNYIIEIKFAKNITVQNEQ